MTITTDIDAVHAFVNAKQPINRAMIKHAFGFLDEQGMYGALVFYGNAMTLPDGRGESIWMAAYMNEGHTWVPEDYVAVFTPIYEMYQTVKCSVRADNVPAVMRCQKTGFVAFYTHKDEQGNPLDYQFHMTREQCVFLSQP